MGDSSDLGAIRVGEAERGLAVTALWEHLDAGRLTPGEHEKRCAHAAAARTRSDIEALFVDLPAPHPDLSGALPPTKPADVPKPATVGETLAGVGAMVLLFGVAASITLTILYGMWWTFFATGALVTATFVLSDVVDRRQSRAEPDQPSA